MKKHLTPEITDDLFIPKKILLGQLGAHGDCLFATAVARQIKTDFPDCHLTWAIGSAYRSVIYGNPFVDEVWEIPIANHQELWDKWVWFEKEAFLRKESGDFDEVFLTQIPPNNFKNFDGTVRSSIFRGYPKKITESVAPVIHLSPDEVENVRRFAETHGFAEKKHIILFECSSASDQSFVTPEFAVAVAQMLVSRVADVCVVLSSNVSMPVISMNIIDGSKLSFRENAELTKYCSLVVGCSSGISWLCTSDWAKQLPMLQLLKKDKSVYASFIHDYEYRGLPTDLLIEMTDCSADKVANCLVTIFNEGFSHAKLIFNEDIPLRFKFYIDAIFNFLIVQGKYNEAYISLKYTIKRYGLHPHLLFCILYRSVKYILRLALKGRP